MGMIGDMHQHTQTQQDRASKHTINSKDSSSTFTHLGPESDGVREGVHGVGVASDEEATKEDALQLIAHCIQIRQLPNVVSQHAAQGHCNISWGILCKLLILADNLRRQT